MKTGVTYSGDWTFKHSICLAISTILIDERVENEIAVVFS